MSRIQCLLLIAQREEEQAFQDFFRKENLYALVSTLGEGTAEQSVLNMLGLEKTDKIIFAALMDNHKARTLMRRLVSDMGIAMPGCGVALRLSVGSIGGTGSAALLLEGQNIVFGEASPMEESHRYDLLIAVSNSGSADRVMAAARGAGAGGGTIVHAKGASAEMASTLFGMSIAPEKEILLIVTRHEQKNAIMHAVMELAGAHLDTHTAIFSLPVDDVAGLRSVVKEDDE